jgi:hypothetical protein
VVECKNQRKGAVDWLHCDLPSKEDLQAIKPGNYVRLQAEGGSYLWALVLRVYGRQLVVIADDTLRTAEVRRGDELVTSTSAVFSIV